MEMILQSRPSSAHCTIGELAVDGAPECFTLEDVVRDVKIKGETAIPAGRYKVIVTYSNRFDRLLPLLVDVPGFEGVRIHPGNTDKDTEGCILTGTQVMGESIVESRKAFAALFEKIQAADECWIEVRRA